MNALRQRETNDQNQHRLLQKNRREHAARRALQPFNDGEAFSYDPQYQYENDPNLSIGPMNTICNFCNALKWKNEAPGICCSGGKAKLPPLMLPPELT